MSETLPALCLIAVPGRRRRTIELCQEAERRGYAGIYVPSPFGNMSMCEAMAWNTRSVTFGTSIAPIYQRTIVDFAQSAAMMHEVPCITTLTGAAAAVSAIRATRQQSVSVRPLQDYYAGIATSRT